MTGTVMIIFAAIMALVIILGAVTKMTEGASPAWKELAEKYPPAPRHGDAITGESRIVIAGADLSGRRTVMTVRYEADDDHLHLRLVSGRPGPLNAMSAPWAETQLGPARDTALGRFVPVTIDGIVLMIPEKAVEREIEVQRHLPPPHDPPQDPLAEEIT